jgi:hypothetical protein
VTNAPMAAAAASAALQAAWAGVPDADRVPPELRTNEPDAGYHHLAGPRVLQGAVRHLYAVRLAGRDPDRYRSITQVGLRFTLDTLHRDTFDAYVAWLDRLELAYPGLLDRLVAAYRAADAAPITGDMRREWKPTFSEVIDAYDARAAEVARQPA